METKTDWGGIDRIQNLLCNEWDVIFIPASGQAGGIAVFWRTDRVRLQGTWSMEQVLFGVVREISCGSQPWIFQYMRATMQVLVRRFGGNVVLSLSFGPLAV